MGTVQGVLMEWYSRVGIFSSGTSCKNRLQLMEDFSMKAPLRIELNVNR